MHVSFYLSCSFHFKKILIMENESRAVAIGLGAGLGRFVDFVGFIY
jgi:uncharacterized protein (DUF2062 family)